MSEVHAVAGEALLGVIVLFVLLSIGLALTRGASGWFEGARRLVVGAVAVQAGIGAVLYLLGDRPAETLHLLYGAVAVAALPLAASFASEAPPKARAGTLALAGVVTIGVVFRSIGTG